MQLAYIGLGSNLATPKQQIETALTAIQSLADCQLVSCSSLYASKPMGPADQPDYVNAVACVQTKLAPHDLLHHLQQIEQDHGRERKAQRWGPRTLDLDILLFGNEQLNDETLTVPHYGLCDREFVLYPLYEIAPQLVLPDGRSLHSVLQTCPLNGLSKI